MKNSNLLLMMILLIPAAGLADDSPFSSIEERNFVLSTAGLDGQIDQGEWNVDRPFFQNLTWENLRTYDHDGDGLIGVNEFFRFVKHSPRFPDAPVGVASKPLTGDQPAMRTASLTMEVPARKEQVLTRRQLFQRTHIARRTKFMKPLNPDVDFIAEKQRAEQLKVITDKRRYAASQRPSKSGEEKRKLRDLYKSRLVKNRFSSTSAAEPSNKRSSLKNSRNRSSGADEGPSWRRSMLNDRLQRGRSQDQSGGGATTPPPSSNPREVQKQSPRVREASNIRSLIPKSKSDGSKARKEIKDINRKR